MLCTKHEPYFYLTAQSQLRSHFDFLLYTTFSQTFVFSRCNSEYDVRCENRTVLVKMFVCKCPRGGPHPSLAARASQSGECPAFFVQGRQQVWKPGAAGRPHAHGLCRSVTAVSSLQNLPRLLLAGLLVNVRLHGESFDDLFRGSG